MEQSTSKNWAQWFELNGPKLNGYLKSAFPWMDHETVQDWLQHAMLLAIESALDPETVAFSYVWQPVKNDVIDWLRRRERESLVALESPSSGEWQPPDLNQHEPPSQVLRQEKETRREKLVSDVLRDFTVESERRGLHREHEVMERSLRGQSRQQIATELGLEINAVYAALSRANKRLLEHVARKDVNQTVFTTFHGEASQHGSLTQLIRWTIEQTGAMCPSPQRLDQFLHLPESQQHQQTDLWFHVHAAKCSLCSTSAFPG